MFSTKSHRIVLRSLIFSSLCKFQGHVSFWPALPLFFFFWGQRITSLARFNCLFDSNPDSTTLNVTAHKHEIQQTSCSLTNISPLCWKTITTNAIFIYFLHSVMFYIEIVWLIYNRYYWQCRKPCLGVCVKAKGPCNIHQNMWTTKAGPHSLSADFSVYSLHMVHVHLTCAYNIPFMHRLIFLKKSAFQDLCISLHQNV